MLRAQVSPLASVDQLDCLSLATAVAIVEASVKRASAHTQLQINPTRGEC